MVGKIKFVIDESGEIQLSVEGAAGKSCEALTQPFESELGVVAKREYKDAYYQSETSLEQEQTT